MLRSHTWTDKSGLGGTTGRESSDPSTLGSGTWRGEDWSGGFCARWANVGGAGCFPRIHSLDSFWRCKSMCVCVFNFRIDIMLLGSTLGVYFLIKRKGVFS